MQLFYQSNRVMMMNECEVKKLLQTDKIEFDLSGNLVSWKSDWITAQQLNKHVRVEGKLW